MWVLGLEFNRVRLPASGITQVQQRNDDGRDRGEAEPAAAAAGEIQVQAAAQAPPHRRRNEQLSLGRLLESLLLARLLRSALSLPEVLYRAVAFILGAEEAMKLKERMAQKTYAVPSDTQLSHARFKLDCLLMHCRRSHWAEFQRSQTQVWIVLSSDASPQGGLEYFVTLEDRFKHPGLLVDSSREEVLEWCRSSNLQSSTLAPCIIGSGNAGTAAKFEALLHSVMLDVPHDSLELYGHSVLGYCSDYGVEGHLTEDAQPQL